MTLIDLEWPCYVIFCFVFDNSCSQFPELFTYMESAIMSILGIDNIFGEGHMYKRVVGTKLLNI